MQFARQRQSLSAFRWVSSAYPRAIWFGRTIATAVKLVTIVSDATASRPKRPSLSICRKLPVQQLRD